MFIEIWISLALTPEKNSTVAHGDSRISSRMSEREKIFHPKKKKYLALNTKYDFFLYL